MNTPSNNNDIYIGRQAGKEIHKSILSAKSCVKIVSPYLSPDYIQDLIFLHKKGIKITLITCDSIESNQYSKFKPSDLVIKEKVEDYSSAKSKSFLAKILRLLFPPIPNYNYKPLFDIKVFDSSTGKNPRSTELIHSKIYLIDNKIAFLGSANLTYSGFKTHYETTIKVSDPSAIQDISTEIDSLYNSTELKSKPIKEWMISDRRGIL